METAFGFQSERRSDCGNPAGSGCHLKRCIGVNSGMMAWRKETRHDGNSEDERRANPSPPPEQPRSAASGNASRFWRIALSGTSCQLPAKCLFPPLFKPHHFSPDPPGATVLDVGCGNGNLLAQLRPQVGIGIDLNPEAIDDARGRYPEFAFHACAVEDISTLSLPKVDYVIVSGVLQQIYDLHTALAAIATVCHADTRLIFCTFSRLWHPVIRLAEKAGRKMPLPAESWIPPDEIVSLLTQGNYAVVRQRPGVLMPLGVPLLADAINRWIAPFPAFVIFRSAPLPLPARSGCRKY